MIIFLYIQRSPSDISAKSRSSSNNLIIAKLLTYQHYRFHSIAPTIKSPLLFIQIYFLEMKKSLLYRKSFVFLDQIFVWLGIEKVFLLALTPWLFQWVVDISLEGLIPFFVFSFPWEKAVWICFLFYTVRCQIIDLYEIIDQGLKVWERSVPMIDLMIVLSENILLKKGK